MYAIVDIAGQQFKVEKNSKLYVHRLEANEGDKVEFDKVMLIDDDGKVNIGTPVLDGALISASVVAHVRGDKVKVFKKKRRKGYQKLNGHRQDFSEILIDEIVAKGAKKAAAKKAETKEEVKPAAEAKETKVATENEPKAETAEKKAAPKKKAAAPKKEEAKAEKSSETKKAAPKKETKASSEAKNEVKEEPKAKAEAKKDDKSSEE